MKTYDLQLAVSVFDIYNIFRLKCGESHCQLGWIYLSVAHFFVACLILILAVACLVYFLYFCFYGFVLVINLT